MSRERMKDRRPGRRAFRPTLDAPLESRVVMSHALPGTFYISHPKIGYAYATNNPPFLSQHAPPFERGYNGRPHGTIQVGHGGQTARVFINGSVYNLQLTEFIPTAVSGVTNTTTLEPTTTSSRQTSSGSGPFQFAGTIRAYPMPGGQVGIIIDGTNALTELDINPAVYPQRKGYAHSFAYGWPGRNQPLNIGSLTVTSGSIGAILGYHTANLAGPLTINGNGNTDRIAFNSLEPGASITTGGDVNTLDVLYNATLSGPGTGVSIGRDLNFMDIGGHLTVTNGASFFVGRDLGAVAQPVKGTEVGLSTASSTLTNSLYAGALIQGNMTVDPGSSFVVGQRLSPGVGSTSTGLVGQPAIVNIRGSLYGANQVIIPGAILSGPGQNVFIGGTATP